MKHAQTLRQPLWLLAWMCKVALKKPAPSVIPTAGDKQAIAARDYFLLNVFGRRSNAHFVAKGMDKEGHVLLTGYYRSHTRKSRITLKTLSKRTFTLTQFFRTQEVFFTSASDFLLSYHTRRHLFLYAKDSLFQRIFNSIRLTPKNRMRILQTAVRNMSDTGSELIDPIKLIPGNLRRAGNHPQIGRLIAQNNFILESFIHSGEIERDDLYSFKVAPKALATIDNYSLERKRHRTLQLLQVIGVVVAAGQLLNVTPGTALDRVISITLAKAQSLWAMAQPAVSYLGSPWVPEPWVLSTAEYLQRWLF